MNHLMLFKTISLLTFLILAPGAYSQENDHYAEVKLSVIDFFKRGAGTPVAVGSGRITWRKILRMRKPEKMMVGFCDSDFDFSKPLFFSGISEHKSEGESWVCGVVSGKTQLGRKIGARFISAEPYHLILGFKYSRCPIAYATDDEFVRDELRVQIRRFNELNDKVCR